MTVSRLQRFFPFLAVLGSDTSLGLGTSWAKQVLFPAVGAQGTTAAPVGRPAVLMPLFRPWHCRPSRHTSKALA